MNNTKVVATLGPACETKQALKKMVNSGMDVARLNFSHGSYKQHKFFIKTVRDLAKETNKPLTILQDLQGPRIRVGNIDEKGVELIKGKKIVLHFGITKSADNNILPIDLKEIPRLKKGSRILIHDGLVELKVTRVLSPKVECLIIQGGMLFSHKGVNIPNAEIKTPVITVKDKKDLEFGLKNKIDWVALSFVGSGQDILDLKKLIKKIDPTSIVKVMAKIERPVAVKNIDEIIEAADGIMVARGDLGVEVSPQKVPIIQKKIIAKCLMAAKPVLVATQMLDSMIKNSVPTRAEASDVANAVIDHTDAVMLSGETAFGKYPTEAVKMMGKIVKETEKSPFDDMQEGFLQFKKDDHYQAVADSVFDLVKSTDARAIVVLSRSGFSARLIARHRPDTKIIAMVTEEEVRRQLNIVWGVQAYRVNVKKSIDVLIKQAVDLVKKLKLVNKGSNVVIVSGQPVGESQHANLVEVYRIN